MASKPILFNTEMVRAILDGKKTQTRRVVKPQPPEELFEGPYWYEPGVANKDGELEPGKPIYGISATDGEWGIKCPYHPGQILWVRETWSKKDGHYFYKAGHELLIDSEPLIKRWRPSIFMPRKAARTFLRVTNVRVERLQDITEDEAIKEGARAYGHNNCSGTSARIAFAEIWDKTTTEHEWRTNPWVWVYEFERISKEEAERLEGSK